MLESRNLLVITQNYSSFVKDPIDLISKNFNHVYVLVRHNPFAEISNYVPINYLKPFRKKSLIDLTDNPENVTVIPTPVIYAPTDRWYKKLGDQHFKVVNRIISKNKINFDLIHSHFTWTSGYVGTKLKERYGTPLVITSHGFDIYNLPFKDDEWSKKIQYVLNSADFAMTVSNSNLQLMKKLIAHTPTKILPNGFKRDFFFYRDKEETRNVLNLPINKKIIFTAGHLIEVKGHKFLVEAMNEIVKSRKDTLCLIAGSGSQKNSILKQIKKLRLQDYVKLVGEIPHCNIPLWINACDIFVLSSLNEGNPTVMFEALGCGKPFIGTKVGGIPEIISSNEYGFLVKSKDPQDLSEKMLIALNKKWDYRKIANYSEQFTWNNLVKKILEIYVKLLV